MLPPVVKTTHAQIPTPLTDTQLASNTDYCAYDQEIKIKNLYHAFTMLPYQKKDTYLSDSIIIAKDKSKTVSSVTPAKTVLKKAEPESEQIIEVTPPTVSVTPIPLPQVTPDQSAGSSGSVLNAETLFQMVNSYRSSVGLAAFEKDPRICEVATSRGPELDNEVYGSSYMHAGFKARNLPYWATENMISMRTEAEALQWWLNSPIHRSAILGNYKYACVSCAGKSCAMIFTNFDPKVQPAQTVANASPLNK